MFMRYLWGHAIGHSYSRVTTSADLYSTFNLANRDTDVVMLDSMVHVDLSEEMGSPEVSDCGSDMDVDVDEPTQLALYGV